MAIAIEQVVDDRKRVLVSKKIVNIVKRKQKRKQKTYYLCVFLVAPLIPLDPSLSPVTIIVVCDVAVLLLLLMAMVVVCSSSRNVRLKPPCWV